jgi:DNA-binding Lrp family transcriptional regulator
MAKAHVLLDCDIGQVEVVIDELKSIIGVKEVHEIMGGYDIIASLETETAHELSQLIVFKIRKIPNVRSTLTLMSIEGQS